MTLAALDYETKSTYSVTVTASDSGGGLSDSIDVTITVTGVDEMREVTLWDGAACYITTATKHGWIQLVEVTRCRGWTTSVRNEGRETQPCG